MKRLIAAVCAMLVGAGVSYGGMGVFVSQWSPDEGDDTIGGGAKFELGSDTVGLEIRGSYFDEDFLTIIPADVGLVLHLPLGDSQLGLYAMGGGSWYFLDADNVDVDDEIGWYAGGGVKLALGEGLAIFAEAQYRSLEWTAEGDDVNEIEDNDIDYSAMTYNAGLLFEF